MEIAASGDTIDLRGLSCGLIRLTSGQIEVPQADLSLVGRGRDALSISGTQSGRVFAHTGTGTLRIRRLSVAYGRYETGEDIPATGGCIDSAGTVELVGVKVHHCTVYSPGGLAGPTNGGGVAAERIVASYSRIYANSATDNGTGGGLFANEIEVSNSEIFNNTVAGTGGGISAVLHAMVFRSVIRDNVAWDGGGGLFSYGTVDVQSSTISGNQASSDFQATDGGGVYVNDQDGRSTIVNSTISGNWGGRYAAMFLRGDASISNSTITGNFRVLSAGGQEECQDSDAVWGEAELHLESSIVAGNTCPAPGGSDIGAGDVVGSRNLIGIADVPVPADTLGSDARLGPLADNGGPTRTHRPLADSPAINAGNNLLGLRYDQRGAGFPRARMNQPDIGAIER
jgi:hypothetical protein